MGTISSQASNTVIPQSASFAAISGFVLVFSRRIKLWIVTKRRERREKAKESQARAAKTGGTLNGTAWSESESRDALYAFAKDEGLEVKSRDSKAAIVKALHEATAAQA